MKELIRLPRVILCRIALLEACVHHEMEAYPGMKNSDRTWNIPHIHI